MRLWFLCCVLLFMAAQIYDWLSHQTWMLADLSMPWVILGGVGLAIASNRSLLKPPSYKTSADVAPASQDHQKPAAKAQTLQGKPAIAAPQSPHSDPSPSISFEIAPPERP